MNVKNNDDWEKQIEEYTECDIIYTENEKNEK